MQVRFVDAGRIRTRIIEAGRGPNVLFLHPVGFSADIWFRNVPALARRFQIAAPDLLGHGFTDLYDRAGRLDHGSLVAHLEACVSALGWKDFSIVGSSFGAQLALLLYLRMPDRISRLVVVGSGTAIQSEAEISATLRKTLANATSAYDTPTWDSCRSRLVNLCFSADSARDELLLSQMTSYAREGAAEAYRSLLAAMLDSGTARPYRVRERLKEIRAPTLLVWGREDPRASYEKACAAVPLFGNAALWTFEECGHLPFLEHPDKFNRGVASFLDDAQIPC